MEEKMITVENLTKKFGKKTAVDNVSFSLEKGEIMGFIGPNGAGKSTTMRMITGFLTPTSGSIRIDKYNIMTDAIKAKSLIGYLPENAPLYSNKTVSEFLEFAAELRGFRRKEKYNRVNRAIETCFLENVRHQVIDTLSKGYRQRTCFAQALIHDPAILILDEPTDGLDPNQKMEVRKLITAMGKEKAIIISTHILEEVEAVTSKVILISDGVKRFDGTPEDFSSYSTSANTYTLQLLDVDIEVVEKILNSLDCIKNISVKTKAESNVCFEILPNKSYEQKEFQKQIAEKAAANQWKIIEFMRNTGKLNEVFAQFTNNANSTEEIGK